MTTHIARRMGRLHGLGRARRRLRVAMLALLGFMTAGVARSQESGQESTDQGDAQAKAASIHWTKGPATGNLNSIAQVEVPAGCAFRGGDGAQTFLELTQNIPNGNEVGALYCRDRADTIRNWFVNYSFDPSGYVRDDEKGKLDPDAILQSIRGANDEANSECRKRGWSEMTVDAWVRPPYYDERTDNLTWAFSGHADVSDTVINQSVRLLARQTE